MLENNKFFIGKQLKNSQNIRLKHILKKPLSNFQYYHHKNYEKYTAQTRINALFLFNTPGLYSLISLHFLHFFSFILPQKC